MPSMVQIAVGAATTSLSEPAAGWLGFDCGWFAVADVTVSTSLLLKTIRLRASRDLSPDCQFPVCETMAREMDRAFADAARELLSSLASGGEPPLPAGGGLGRVLRETGATSSRAAIGALVDRWFRAPPISVSSAQAELLLNRPDLSESEKLHGTLREHVIGQWRWQELSSNESTFYRYRRTAIAAFS